MCALPVPVHVGAQATVRMLFITYLPPCLAHGLLSLTVHARQGGPWEESFSPRPCLRRNTRSTKPLNMGAGEQTEALVFVQQSLR